MELYALWRHAKPSMEDSSFCIWCWTYRRDRQVGINDGQEMVKSKDILELTSGSHCLQLR